MPEYNSSNKFTKNNLINSNELTLQKIVQLLFIIVIFGEYIFDFTTKGFAINNFLVIFVVLIPVGTILFLSFVSHNFKVTLSNQPYLLYSGLFILNWLIDAYLGIQVINHSLAIIFCVIALIKFKSIKQLLLYISFSTILYFTYIYFEKGENEQLYFIIFFSLNFGVALILIINILSERRYSFFEKSISSIFNNLSEPILILSEGDLSISYCNALAEKIIKSTKAEIDEKSITFNSLISPDSRVEFEDIITRLKLGEFQNWDGEMEMLTVSGEKIWVFFRLNVVRFPDNEKYIIKITDISKSKSDEVKIQEALLKTEQQNLELLSNKKAIINVMEDLQRERDKAYLYAGDLQKFQLAVENASDHIVITDPEGITLYSNPAASRITGFTKEEIINSKAGKLWSLPMPHEFYADFWDVIKNQKKTYEGEIQNKRKNGEKYYAQFSISPILNEKKEVVFFVGIERDVTKAKEIDKIRKEFVSVASHQLRTPLTSIKWYIEMFQEDTANLSQTQKDILNEVESSNQRMISLVNDLLNVSRIETGGKYSITKTFGNIITTISDTINEQQVLAKNRNISINFNNNGFNEFLMNFDKPKLYQALSNLVSNAIKYSYENSSIDIIFERTNETEITIKVEDHGIGIPENGKNRIFDKFYRAENAVKVQTDGTGLGLYFARTIVLDHGGQMWFDSIEGQGTTFTMKIPVN